jgi:ribosomal protein S18 acetylase RimI-like enzyme
MNTRQIIDEPRLAEDAWLAARLGKPAFHLKGDLRRLEQYAENLTRQLARGALFVDAKVLVDDVMSVGLIQRLGFALIDTHLRFSLKERAGAYASNSNISFARAEMAERIGTIAEKFLVYDRFHRDPVIPSAVARSIKRDWATNFFAGLRGDWMVVAVREGTPVGFLQLLQSPRGELVIDLIAVDGSYRRQGIARSMIGFAIRHCDTTGPVIVGTQAANVHSIQLYESIGFRFQQAQYVFHHHGVDGH